MHPKRSGRNHLRALAATSGISDQRVEEVLDIVGLTDVADRAAGGFSLGMSQRLGIASALLGDPSTVMLDEPVNGLDPEGVLWIRHLLKDLAAEGRTVLVSSHLMSEMAMTAEHFIIIGRGRMIADVTATELDALGKESSVLVRADDNQRMRTLLTRDGVAIRTEPDDAFSVAGIDSFEIGRIAAANSIALVRVDDQAKHARADVHGPDGGRRRIQRPHPEERSLMTDTLDHTRLRHRR